MTKKDYIKIAEIIKHQVNRSNLLEVDKTLSDLAQDLAVVFASDNPRFNQDKFLEACGL